MPGIVRASFLFRDPSGPGGPPATRVTVRPLRRGTLAATGRLLARRGCDRRAVLRELGRLMIQDTRRRRLNRNPVYIDDNAIADSEHAVK